MKAFAIDDYGVSAGITPREWQSPTVGPEQVLVRMRAAGVTPFDVKLVDGVMKDQIPLQFPFVPGSEGAGVVEQVGANVDGFQVGDEVFGTFDAMSGGGAYAQLATAKATGATLAIKLSGLDWSVAAAIPQSSLTARSLFRAAGVRPDERVLVIGATGGIGTYLVPFAADAGGYVIATATSDDATYVQSIGAKEIIDYQATDVAEELARRHAEGVDVAFDLVNYGESLTSTVGLLRNGGRLVSPLGGPSAGELGRDDVSIDYVSLKAERGDLEDLGRRVADGRLKVEISATYSLDETGKALSDKNTKHTRGKRIITIN